MGSEVARIFGADQQNAKQGRPITESGPDDKTKPIVATGPR
jgi:hypothetical protein